jgi:hypothetical protein
MGLVSAFLAMAQQVGGWGQIVDGWRKRREAVAKRSKPTYDAYPERDLPVEVTFYLSARNAYGQLIREQVNLEGYSIHQLNWKRGARRGNTTVRDWFVEQMLEAYIVLEARLDLAREQKAEGRKEFNYDPRTRSR